MDGFESVELREVRVFLTLAEELHFGRAAERLNLTSSRVSQLLLSLERKLGGRLVYRTSRRVELTALGERFRDDAGVAYAGLVGVLERTRAANRARRQTVRIATATPLTGGPRFFEIIKAFQARQPECVVETVQLPQYADFGPLRRDEVDSVATWLPHGQPDVVVGPILNEEPRVLAVAADHALAAREIVSLEDVVDYRVIRAVGWPKAFHEEWVPSRTGTGRPIPSQRFDRDTHGDLVQMVYDLGYLVAAGKLVHPTVPSIAKLWGHLDIAYIPLSGMRPLRSALLWRRRQLDPILREFVELARAARLSLRQTRALRSGCTSTSGT